MNARLTKINKNVRTKALIVTLVIFPMFFIATACSSQEVSLGHEFSLRIGENASIKGEELQVRFLEVTEDSRCPTGVVCIWEGRVNCLVEITYRESIYRVGLTEPGLTSYLSENVFIDYKITYHVEPYPQAGTEIATEDYRLDLRISK